VLVGHSMGGPVAVYAALRMPERVTGVVVLDTLHDLEAEVPPGAMEDVAAQFEQDFTGTMTGMARSAFDESADPAVVQRVLDGALAADPAVAVALMRDFEGYDPQPAARQLGVPLRAINAAPRKDGDRETALLSNGKHCDYEAVLIDGVGHFLLLERPAEVNEALRTFVAGFAPQPAPPTAIVDAAEVRFRTTRPPAYPAEAKRLGQEGAVKMRVLFDAEGLPTDVEVLEGPEIFVPFAVEAVQQWRAEPYLDEQDSAQPFRMVIRVQFILND